MTTITMDDGKEFEVTESTEVVMATLSSGGGGGQARRVQFASFTKLEDDLPIFINIDHIASVMEYN
ncbi:MAG TPA: hypothetical protein VLA89_10220 [Gemmatimonadales bacterium]|nr:hypothetical protein [Gemmatimonadales bacterium]